MWYIGNAPTSWGIEKSHNPGYPSWNRVLDEISVAGYRGTDLGPYGFFPTDASVLREELETRNVTLSGCTVMTPLDDTDRIDEIESLGRKSAQLTKMLGGKYLVIIDGFGTERENTAGRSHDAPRLDAKGWDALSTTVSRLISVAVDTGLRCVFHPHAGTRVEFQDEIERLLETFPAKDLGICFDTGHLSFAGLDPAKMMDDHADRLDYVHLKDINRVVLEETINKKLDFWQSYRKGVFCPLGTGSVNFDSVREVLINNGYEGWLTVEQDADPSGSRVALDDAVSSMAYLVQHKFIGAGS